MNIDKIYIISLDHSEENQQSILDRLSIMDLPNQTTYQIIDAVDGRTMFQTEQGREDYGIRFYPQWNVGGSGWWSRDVTAGEAGGICSHMVIWEDAYLAGHENILILEDDFDPHERFPWNHTNEIDGWDWDIVFLSRILQSSHKGVVDTNVGLEHWVMPGYSYQTHSYMLSKSGIQKLIETNLLTLKENIIVSDEFLPATYTLHPRKDIRDLFVRNMTALAYHRNPIGQFRFEAAGNSLTSPVEGIDY
jgi:collagen beta-1,O-galactosyltransferase